MRFEVGDVINDVLPKADLLLTKDTLIHLPNTKILEVLRRNVLVQPPRFKFVLFVHDTLPVGAPPPSWAPGNNLDIALNPNNRPSFHFLNLSAPPFNVAGLRHLFDFTIPGE